MEAGLPGRATARAATRGITVVLGPGSSRVSLPAGSGAVPAIQVLERA